VFGLSRGAISKTLGFAPLVLEKRIGPTCAFSGERPGQYLQGLSLLIIPGSNGVFSLAESDALESAEKEHAEFGVVHKGLFFVYGTMESTKLGACGSEEAPEPSPLETRTGPICAGEPALTHINVIGYGRSPSGLKPMVTAAAVAESGQVHLANVINLVEDIISGKIH